MEEDTKPVSETAKKRERARTEERPFSEYKVGDLLPSGNRIDWIQSCSDHYLICWSEGRLSYHVRNLQPHQDCAVQECRRLFGIHDVQFGNAYRDQFSVIIGNCLANALMSKSKEDALSQFNPVKQFHDEKGPLQNIYCRETDCMVFRDKKGAVKWECKIDDTSGNIIRVYDGLRALARSTLPKKELEDAYEMIATELAQALRSRNFGENKEIFTSSRSFLEKRAASYARTRYLSASLVSALMAAVALDLVYNFINVSNPTFQILVVGATGGAMGSVVSVIHRLKKLDLDLLTPYRHLTIQAFSRMLLGLFFGIIAGVAMKCNIVLGALGKSSLGLFLTAIVAGFSERFIPDMLDTLGAKKGKTPGKSSSERDEEG